MKNAVSRKILAVRGNAFSCESRDMVEEVDYTVQLHHRPVGRFSCSPWDIREAVIGWLWLNGHISGMDQLVSLEIREDCRSVLAETKEAPPAAMPDTPPLSLKTGQVAALSALLEARSGLFRQTGGVHCAALADGQDFLAYAEDISRHAAVDKLAGACLEAGIATKNKILVFSGRVPGDVVRMAATMGCTVIIARSAPTELACSLAEELDITLIGFAREADFNIYTCPQRIEDLPN